MKTIILSAFLLFASITGIAQWENVAIPGAATPVTSMYTWGEILMAGTLGDGIFKTEDNGANWTDISGNIGNKYVNNIRGGAVPTQMWVSTQNGPFYTEDLVNYSDNTSTGLTTTDISYYWFGGDNGTPAEWAIGTNGGGMFISPELTGPWTASNNGISGNGLYINDMGGYSDSVTDYAVIGTNDGVYFSTDNLASWAQKNNGLSGGMLQVNALTGMGPVIYIATDNGMIFTYDLGDNWYSIIPDEKFNTLGAFPNGPGVLFLVFGDGGYYSIDALNFFPLDMSGVNGEVTCFAVNSTHVFIGIQDSGKDGKLSGGVLRKPIDQIITSTPEIPLSGNSNHILQQNYPNPFTSSTTISYLVSEPGFVSLKVYDNTGREIKTLVNTYRKKGAYSVEFTPEIDHSSILFYTLQINGCNIAPARKMAFKKN